MSEIKTVYCKIKERCKKIKYIKKENVSEANCILNALNNAIANDNLLQLMTKNKIIVLQIKEGDRFCDLEPEDEIENKSELRVLLLDLIDEIVVPLEPNQVC